jgi:DNA polymerase I-like protein with 3'-5' exonuclease and polymerase domains
MHGLVVYSRKFNCWVASSYHPAFFLRRKNKPGVPNDENLFVFDIAKALSYLGKTPIEPLTEAGNKMLSDTNEAIRAVNEMCESVDPVGYDYETFRLTPFEPEAELLSISFTNKVDLGYFIPFGLVNPATGQKYFNLVEQGYILEAWKRFLTSKTPKLVQNLNMEELWNREYLHQPMSNFIHDTMLAQHVLNCNTLTTSLAFQVFEMCGHDYKEMVNCKDLRKEDPLKIFHYNCWDARYTLMSYYHQLPRLQREGRLLEFNDLLQRGSMVLVELRRRGVLIDVNVLKDLEEKYEKEKKSRVRAMASSPGVVQYLQENVDTRGFKGFNPESTSQMGKILYGVYQVPLFKKTKTERGAADVEALEMIQKKTDNENVKELIKNLFRYRKCGTLLKRAANYRRLMDTACLVHPIFNLHIADTYRSSSDSPNIQNVFKHDKELKKFRRIIIPTPGNILLEVDYSGLEVRVIAMASKDQELTRQIIQGVDTHKRWAGEIYRKPLDLITSDERYESKNGFIFASFYGATADSIARKFPTAPEGHIAFVQDKFWNEFYGVRTWQRRTIEMYRDCGYVEGMSGFRRYGPLTINKLYNTPIQGPAFHLMVGALIQIEKVFAERGLRSRPVFEIHDSVTIDTVPSEAEEMVQIVTEIMCAKRFDWQGIVPLGVEWEVGITNWYDLTNLEFGDCDFCHVHGPMGHSKDKKDLSEGRKQITHSLQCGTCRQVKNWVEVK